ncbi:hypothetical protein [Nioella aestuarii]|uniref:hypothetical protein n=1 Tax=Nioella aestuarii TaxID=1662864 RepID=UPI003D7F8B3B
MRIDLRVVPPFYGLFPRPPCGAQSPNYMAKPGTSWDPMILGNSVLQDKVLSATDCMLLQQRVVSELLDTAPKASVKDKWLGG